MIDTYCTYVKSTALTIINGQSPSKTHRGERNIEPLNEVKFIYINDRIGSICRREVAIPKYYRL